MPPLDYERNPPIGIDLGTTFSAIARWNGREPEAYPVRGDKTLQSVVFYDDQNDQYLAGKLAFNRTILKPECGIVGVKRMMDNRDTTIRLCSKEHSPIDISAKILEAIYQSVVQRFPPNHFRSRGVVVTVPYYFRAHQVSNTREAANLAKLNLTGILQEPIAASLHYALQVVRESPSAEREELMLVFDLGGGTFDLTLFKLKLLPHKLHFEVIATGGNDRLGGMDFDECLMNFVVEKERLSLDSLDPPTLRRVRRKLLERSTEVKEDLSFSKEATFAVGDVLPGRHIDVIVKQEEFNRCIDSHLRNIERTVEDLFARTGISPTDVGRVIKVGGSSQIPAVDDILSDIVGPGKVYGNIDQALCVATGAAIYAGFLDDPSILGREIEITRRSCHGLGIEIDGGRFFELIPSNRKTPCQIAQVFEVNRRMLGELSIKVLQGDERDYTEVGVVRGHWDGESDVVVTFTLDDEQRLKVDVKSGEYENTDVLETH